MEGNNFQFKLLSLNVRGIRTFETKKVYFQLTLTLKQKGDIFSFKKRIVLKIFKTNGGNSGEET